MICKMQKKSFLIIIGVVIALFSCNAQISKKRLKVGDVIPNVQIKNVLNTPKSTLQISDFEGKLLLLDFWATWCTPCVATFSKLDKLKRQFAGEFAVLSITSEETTMVSAFIKKMKSINNVSPVVVANDSLFNSWFRHLYVPHYVWIDKYGKVIAITSSEEINEANIRSVINGDNVSFPVKDDFKKKVLYSRNYPMFILSSTVQSDDNVALERIPDSSLKMYSALTGFIEGFSPGFHQHKPNLFSAKNLSIQFLYKIATSGASSILLNSYPGSVKIEVTDSVLYNRIVPPANVKGKQYNDWIRENGYCYDLKVPSDLSSNKFKFMLDDLNNYFGKLFGIEGVFEERSQKYLGLVVIGNQNEFISKGGSTSIKKDKFSLKFKNASIKDLTVSLSQPLQLYPTIIDETNYKGKIDLEINCDMSDLHKVNTELKKYGLQLLVKEKMMNVPVIKIKP